MPFEYDHEKNEANKKKHGIDFEAAQELWHDTKAFEAKTPHTEEERFTRTGQIGNKLWTVVFTYRGENIRLISVRRARADEEKRYEAE